MNLEHFENILKNKGFEFRYYELIFDVLSVEDQKMSDNDRLNLLSIIKNENFYNYSYHWHVLEFDNKGFIDNLKSLSTFHENNSAIHSDKIYNEFLFDNLIPVLQGELKNYFDKRTLKYTSYDDFDEVEKKVDITFLSPLDIYHSFKLNDLFSDLLDNQIADALISIEKQYCTTNNPVIKEGIALIDKSLKNPESFSEFVDFWSKYKSLLLPSHPVEKDLKLLNKVNPDILDSYCEYIKTPGIFYEFEKSILAKKVTQFYFEHSDTFAIYEGKIANPLLWIYESKHFLSTQHFVNNIQEKHLKYLKALTHNSSFKPFINDVMFSQRLNKDIAYLNSKNMLAKNLDFESFFENYEVSNPTSKEVSNFENYLMELSDKMQKPDLLPFYRSQKLQHKLAIKENYIKPLKI